MPRWLKILLLVGLVAVLLKEIPDMRRYLKIETM